MERFGVIYPKFINPRYDLLDGHAMISDGEVYQVFDLNKGDVGYVNPWDTLKEGDWIEVGYQKWGCNWRDREESLVVTQAFIDSYRAPQKEEPDVKIEVVKEGFRDDEIIRRRLEAEFTDQMSWVHEKMFCLLTSRYSFRDILDIITNPPKVWKIETPKGEGTVIALKKPHVLSYGGRYYMFVENRSRGVDVYRTN